MNCANLSLIPQFSGTCWFNAILTASLYSQHTRKAIIKASKTWNKNDSFLMILKLILKNYRDLQITKNNIIYIFNNKTYVWQKLDNEKKILMLIQDTIHDFK